VTTPYGSRAEGFWNDAGVSSHTTRSVHPHQRAQLKATDVSDGTALEHGSIFTHSPVLWNPPKCSSVENVQKNYLSLLSTPATSGKALNGLPAGSAAFIPVAEARGLSPRFGKEKAPNQ
jgi:hypothetical protein